MIYWHSNWNPSSMKNLFSLLIVFISAFCFAQNEFHVFPIDGNSTKGTAEGNGSINNSWDLQTALSQSTERINGGDIIWLHQGVYTGSYKSSIHSTIKNKKIIVSSYLNEKVILNGNIGKKAHSVLEVNGGNVIFKNFEITYLGKFSRSKSDKNFNVATGISHLKGKDCEFRNLVIHNIPGSGIGSWKATGGTIIQDCVIYNNGYNDSRGHGVGIYIQNQSDKTRLINNNLIFNNYYKGIEVWSASSGSKFEFVKNITLTNNTIFNNGSPSAKYVDNLIIASKDAEGINVAKHIKVLDNVLYHNVDFNDSKNYGHGASLTLGYSANSPIEDVLVENNLIFGKNNALNISQVKSLVFKNNMVYAGYVHYNPSVISGLESRGINMNNNSYYTRKFNGFRINKKRDYKLKDWQETYNIEAKSELKQLKDFKEQPIIKIQKLQDNSSHFNVSILSKGINNVHVHFKELELIENMTYRIYDIENRTIVAKSGVISDDFKIEFPLSLTHFEKPLHNSTATKSANNFGVFRVEFSKPEKKSFFKRLFSWLF